jgi:hypothetical protein
MIQNIVLFFINMTREVISAMPILYNKKQGA